MKISRALLCCICTCLTLFIGTSSVCYGTTLKEIRERGYLRHLAVPYAKFATIHGDGLDCALMKRFAEHLGVQYKLVPTSFDAALKDLTGRNTYAETANPKVVTGDILASGITILDSRKAIAKFSRPTFRSQTWLLAKPASDLQPISSTGDANNDILQTLKLLGSKTVVGIPDTCLDVTHYPLLQKSAANTFNLPASTISQPFEFIGMEHELFLMESASILIALSVWPYQFKIIGPISTPMEMGAVFAPESEELRKTFAVFFKEIWANGEYQKMVNHYYPTAFRHFEQLFTKSAP